MFWGDGKKNGGSYTSKERVCKKSNFSGHYNRRKKNECEMKTFYRAFYMGKNKCLGARVPVERKKKNFGFRLFELFGIDLGGGPKKIRHHGI